MSSPNFSSQKIKKKSFFEKTIFRGNNILSLLSVTIVPTITTVTTVTVNTVSIVATLTTRPRQSEPNSWS